MVICIRHIGILWKIASVNDEEHAELPSSISNIVELRSVFVGDREVDQSQN